MSPSPPPPPVSLSLRKHLSLSFFSRSIPPSLFSPCSDPVQMASRCFCNSFAFSYISSTKTAKKTLEEMLTTYRMARSGRLKIVLCDVLLGLACKKQIYTENAQKAAEVKFPKCQPLSPRHSLKLLRCFQTMRACNMTRLLYGRFCQLVS